MIRRPRIETKINHERWLVSYADFVTLLFALFVVMYSVSHVNEEKYRQLSSTLASAFSSGAAAIENSEATTPEDVYEAKLADIDDLASELQAALAGVIDEDKISLSGNQQWIEIELSANLLFPLGSADVSEEAKKLLAPVAEILVPFDNAVAIAGHTDDMPISNARFDDNWALSSARAVSVVKFLLYRGVDPSRLSAEGYGEYRPVVDNASIEARSRNRRVVIKIAKNAAELPKVGLAEYQADESSNTNSKPLLNSPAEEIKAVSEPEPLEPQELNSTPEAPVDPVRLKGGGLLFSRDPDLPRINSPVEVDRSSVTTPSSSVEASSSSVATPSSSATISTEEPQ